MASALQADGVEVERIRERSGITEAEILFDSFESLCEAPLFARDCAFEVTKDGTRSLRMVVPSGGIPGGGPAEIILRPAGRILTHNQEAAPRRGNRLIWSGLVADGLVLEVTSEPQTVLAITLRTFLRAALIAAGIAISGLVALYLVGKRRLRREPDRWG